MMDVLMMNVILGLITVAAFWLASRDTEPSDKDDAKNHHVA